MADNDKIIQFDEETPMTEEQCVYYVQGMYDLYIMLGGETHCKSYDPVSFWNGVMHSYIMELYTRDRHQNYISAQDVADRALLEFADKFMDFKDCSFKIRDDYRERVGKYIMNRLAALSDEEKTKLEDTPRQVRVIRMIMAGGDR